MPLSKRQTTSNVSSTQKMPASKARDRASSISRSDHSESSGTDPFDFPEEDHDRARPTTKDKGKAPIRPNQTKAVNQTKPLPPASYHEESETESETESDLTDYNAGPSTRNSIWKKPVHGNLVSDLAVPLKILDKVPHANPPNRDEFSHLRYQAITCEALDFISEGYCLRASLFGNPRTTEIMVSVSIYNEDAQVLGRMLEAVFANIAYLCERVKDGVWGKDSWRKVVLVLVNDGAGIFNASSRALLAGLGIYTDDFLALRVAGRDVVAHTYEYSTQIGISTRSGRVRLKRQTVPCQVVFCSKVRPKTAFDSEQWVVSAMGSALNPRVWIPMAIQYPPPPGTLYELWREKVSLRYPMLNDSHSTVGSLPPNWSLPKNLPIALPEQGEEPQIEVSTIQYDKTPSDDRYLDQLRILRRSAEIKGTARPRGTKTNPMSAFKNIRQSIMGFLPHSSTTGS